MNRQKVKSLLRQKKYQEIENDFQKDGHELDEQTLLKDSQVIPIDIICNIFWDSANFLASDNNSINMNENSFLKSYLEESFFGSQDMRSLQEVKTKLLTQVQNPLAPKEAVIQKLWEGLRAIGKDDIDIKIAWAAHLYLSI